MNNKNFKERAETMKKLFLAGIPTDVICEVVQLSESTVRKDRERIAKHYGIDIPRPLSHYLIPKDLYKFFFKIYLKAWINKDYDDPLYTATGIIIDISSIDDHLNSLQSFYKGLMCPHTSIRGSIEENNMDLIEKLLSNYKEWSDDTPPEEHHGIDFKYEFFVEMYLGKIPYESFNSAHDVKQAATRYFADKKCCRINTLVIKDPGALLMPFLSKLSEIEYKVFTRRYGLNSKRKEMLIDIASSLGITKNRADNICRRAYDKVYHELEEVDFYPFDSSGKMKYLERRYDNIKELQARNFIITEKEIEEAAKMKQLNTNLDWIEKAAESPTHSARVTFLVKKIKDVQLPKFITQRFGKHKHILDIVENWKFLRLDKDNLEIIDNLLKENRVDRKQVTKNDILLSRRIIQKFEGK